MMDERLIAYLHYFTIEKNYYECHEYGESLWLDTGRPTVLKGLIQAAVSLYHLEGGNVKGGLPMWRRAKHYLEPQMPVYEQIDLQKLADDMDDVFSRIPQKWHDRVVSAAAVRSLQLPSVAIRVLDADLERAVRQWQPPSGAESAEH